MVLRVVVLRVAVRQIRVRRVAVRRGAAPRVVEAVGAGIEERMGKPFAKWVHAG